MQRQGVIFQNIGKQNCCFGECKRVTGTNPTTGKSERRKSIPSGLVSIKKSLWSELIPIGTPYRGIMQLDSQSHYNWHMGRNALAEHYFFFVRESSSPWSEN